MFPPLFTPLAVAFLTQTYLYVFETYWWVSKWLKFMPMNLVGKDIWSFWTLGQVSPLKCCNSCIRAISFLQKWAPASFLLSAGTRTWAGRCRPEIGFHFLPFECTHSKVLPQKVGVRPCQVRQILALQMEQVIRLATFRRFHRRSPGILSNSPRFCITQ